MGTFLALSGVASTTHAQVEQALRDYAARRGGQLIALADAAHDERDQLRLARSPQQHCTVLYPASFLDWDAASAFLSEQLARPVFSLHIHDGDFWMYTLYHMGGSVDQFNPLPSYWDDAISDEERASWAGNVRRIEQVWPESSAASIERYLVTWEDLAEQDHGRKAYADDSYGAGQEWQLLDFMQRLGLVYPDGNPAGSSDRVYTLSLPAAVDARPAQRRRPWWKLW